MARYKSYDHRLKILVIESGNLSLFKRFDIPLSTMKTWQNNGINSNFITLDIFDEDKKNLCHRIIKLENELREKDTRLKLAMKSRDILEQKTNWMRFPSKEIKEKIIKLYKTATSTISPKDCAKSIGISLSRLKSWTHKLIKCELEDRSSCPKFSPSKATDKEIIIMKKMIQNPKYAHFPTSNLAVYAAKKGKLFLSPSTWLQYARKLKWVRPRARKYKGKNEIGVRASEVNQIWHIDISVMKLLDNTKVFVQAIIDNYSRCIVAWDVSTKIDGENTKRLIQMACKNMNSVPDLYYDSGAENLNGHVLSLKSVNQVIAQVDVHYSNSMIEAFFRSMKNNFLYFQDLTTVENFKRKVTYYVNEHNNKIPHSALRGATPVEIYENKWSKRDSQNLKTVLKDRFRKRIEENKAIAPCLSCPSS